MLNIKLWKIVLLLFAFGITFSFAFAFPSDSPVLIGPVLNNSNLMDGVRSVNLKVYSASSAGTMWYNQTRSLNFTRGIVIFNMNKSMESIDFFATPYIEIKIENNIFKTPEGKNRTLWANPQITTDANKSKYVNASGVKNEYWYNTAGEVIGGFTGCVGTYYLGADGACHVDSVGYNTEGQLTSLLNDNYANKTEWDALKAYDCGSEYEMVGVNNSGGIKCYLDDSITIGGTEVYVGSASWVRLKANSGYAYWDGNDFYPATDYGQNLGQVGNTWGIVRAKTLMGAWNGTGTLIDGKWCKFTGSSGDIDCNVDVVTNTDNQTIRYNPITNFLCINGGNCTDLSELDDVSGSGGNSTAQMIKAINKTGRYNINLTYDKRNSGSLNFTTNSTITFNFKENGILNGNDQAIDLRALNPEAKAYLSWYGYLLNDSSGLIERRYVGWFGCHYNTTGNSNPHEHCSIETLDLTTGTINSRFEITYGDLESELYAKFSSISYVELGSGVDLLMNGASSDIRHTTDLDIYPTNQAIYGLRISNISFMPSLQALGSGYLIINDNLRVIGKGNFSSPIYTTDYYDDNININKIYPRNGTMNKGQICIAQDNGYINCTYTDQTGSGGNSTEQMQDAVGSGFRKDLIYNDSSGTYYVNQSYFSALYYSVANPSAYISDGNTNWDNSYGYITNATMNKSVYCGDIYGGSDGDYCADATGAGTGDVVKGDNLYTYNITASGIKTITFNQTKNNLTIIAITDARDTDTDTSANIICSGTTTYLDGEGNCDDISGVYLTSEVDGSVTNELDDTNISVTSMQVTGTTTKKLTIEQKSNLGNILTNLTATWTDLDSGGSGIANDTSVRFVNQNLTGNQRLEGTLRSGDATEAGTWRFYDVTDFLMSFYTYTIDFDTWGMKWNTTNNQLQFVGNGDIGATIDLDTGIIDATDYTDDGTNINTLYEAKEATLTDIADGTIAENLVNTANPWADNEVADDVTAGNVEGTDLGTLTNTYYCTYDSVGTEIDCASQYTAASTLTCTDCLSGTQISSLVDADISDTLTASDLVAGSEVVSDAEVVNTITASNYLPLAGGTLTANITAESINVKGQNKTCYGSQSACIWWNGSVLRIE